MEREELSRLTESLHPLELKVLNTFQGEKTLWEKELRDRTALQESQLSMAIGWLQTKGLITIAEEKTRLSVSLTELGEKYRRDGVPEKQIIERLKRGEVLSVPLLKASFEPAEISSALGDLKDKVIIRIGHGGVIEFVHGADITYYDSLQDNIARIGERGGIVLQPHELEAPVNLLLKEILDRYSRKRGKEGVFRCAERKEKKFSLTDEGVTVLEILRERESPIGEISQLTPEMLKDGSWRDKKFRKYNITLSPPRIISGRKHPYREFLDFVKYKLIGMGFKEMRGPIVECEFWNMDALYMPQFHPARDIHDAYFLSEPKYARAIKEPFLKNVSATHTGGWRTGSRGWCYQFSKERAKRLLLRSQGTAVSARTLSEGAEIPGKYFSIARCFRYEQVDATHSCDFFQIEGIVLGEGINFCTLLGLLKLFAVEVARAEESKFLPAYFPFTEPSVELHVKHPKLGWIELGGAGLFRPEVTIPLGITVPVIAWGLGLDRMAMVALDIHDIRDLFSSDLDLIRTKKVEL